MIGYFFSDDKGYYKRYIYWTCEDNINSLNFLFDNINIRFGNKTYQQVVGLCTFKSSKTNPNIYFIRIVAVTKYKSINFRTKLMEWKPFLSTNLKNLQPWSKLTLKNANKAILHTLDTFKVIFFTKSF